MGLDIVELVTAVEDEFEITIPNRIAPTLVRVGDLHAFAVQALQNRGEAVDPGEVWRRLKRVVVEYAAVREEDVVPEASLVDDLRLD